MGGREDGREGNMKVGCRYKRQGLGDITMYNYY